VAGYVDAVLIGTRLMQAEDIEDVMEELKFGDLSNLTK